MKILKELSKKMVIYSSFTFIFLISTGFVYSKGLVNTQDNSKYKKKDHDIVWYNYEPTEVTLEGKLILRKYPGPPNYDQESKKEECLILELNNPINVKGDDSSDLDTDTFLKVTEIQLAIANQKNINEKLNKQIIVKGTLYEAITGHQHTNVLMYVNKIYEKTGSSG